MQDTLAVETNRFVSSSPTTHMQQVPLTFFHDGDCGKIIKVRGDSELQHHLKNIGFVEGAQVRVFSEQAGNVIVEVKDTRVAIDKSVASKIIACL